MVKEVTIPHRFEPREYQLPLFEAVDSGKYKRFYIVYHRRAGKDKCFFNILVKRAIRVVGQHFYMFPTYAQGKKVIWEGRDNNGMSFLEHIPKELVARMNDTDMKVELKNGSIIQIIGTDNFDSIRGTNPMTVAFSEYAFQDPRVWSVVSPILKANGGMALFNTTPNGENHAFELWSVAKDSPDWFTQLLTIEDTKVLTREEIEKEQGISQEMIQQEYYCSWNSALVGAYYANYLRDAEDQGRVGIVPWDDKRSVHTFWDLGMNDEMCIWFAQQEGFAWKIVDCYSNHGYGFEHYTEVLYDKPYRYGKHCVPHDAKNRELSSGLKRAETLDSLLREQVVVLKRPKNVQDKIEATRRILPKCYFDKDKCREGLNALKNYKQQYDDRLKVWKDIPLHDWSSNYADAFAYFAMEAPRMFEPDLSSAFEDQIIEINYAPDRSRGIVR